MLEHGVNRLPVIDGADSWSGIVSRADLVRAFARSDEEIAADAREQVELQQALGRRRQRLVDVDVTDGDAVLTGSVRRRSDAEIAPAARAPCPGRRRGPLRAQLVRSRLTAHGATP